MTRIRPRSSQNLPAWLTLLLIFVVALLPRLYALGSFLTIDEVKWAEGAAQFLLALHAGDLFQTYWHFFPGITTAWGGALALWAMCMPASALDVCVNAHIENLASSIGWLRLPTVLLTSLGIAGVYGVGRKLLGNGWALLTALLLAFDPFFIAHSRIVNGDAVVAILMFLSLLAFLLYWLPGSANGESKHTLPGPDQPMANPHIETGHIAKRPYSSSLGWLILSAVLAGLALLTKLPSPLIGLFVGGLGLVAIVLEWRREGPASLRRWLVALLVWGGIALLVFVVLWPAMWVAPLETLRLVYVDAFEVGGAGEGHDTFFLGQNSSDPGLWFYPYVIPFRLTPIVTLGFLLTIGWLLLPPTYFGLRTGYFLVRHIPSRIIGYASRAALQASRLILSVSRLTYPDSRVMIVTLIMLVYILFVMLLSNASPKKLDRYVMAVIPAIGLMAAAGYDYLFDLVYAIFRRNTGPIRSSAGQKYYYPVVGLVVALQLLFAVFAAPYYLTYYNPLLGGVKRAVTQAPVGWGEGLEQAALYLNGLPNAESLEVSAWYSDIFHPYFVGQRASFADDGRAQLAADYVVFYVNQIQRQKPYPGLVDYFRAGELVFVVAVKPGGQVVNWSGADNGRGNVPWVEVYKAPAAQSISGAPKVEGVAQLLAYKVTGSKDTGNKVADSRVAGSDFELLSDEDVSVTLFLRVLGPLPEETTFSLALLPVTASQNLHSEIQNPRWGRWHSTEIKGEWLSGNIVEWYGRLTLPPQMPPGEYGFWVAFQFKDGPVIAEIPISEKGPSILVREDHK